MSIGGLDVWCRDCAADLLPTGREAKREWCMLHDHVWAQTGLAPDGGYLCLACIEGRIGRPLTGADLTDELPINEPNEADSPRMHALKVAAALRRGPPPGWRAPRWRAP